MTDWDPDFERDLRALIVSVLREYHVAGWKLTVPDGKSVSVSFQATPGCTCGSGDPQIHAAFCGSKDDRGAGDVPPPAPERESGERQSGGRSSVDPSAVTAAANSPAQPGPATGQGGGVASSGPRQPSNASPVDGDAAAPRNLPEEFAEDGLPLHFGDAIEDGMTLRYYAGPCYECGRAAITRYKPNPGTEGRHRCWRCFKGARR